VGKESTDRKVADELLLKHLAKDGFKGPDYDRFQNELARYSISVLRAWMCSGAIFRLTARYGFGLEPTGEELQALHRDSDLREELAGTTVACALRTFRQRALIEGGWTGDGGACITTYFMGACLRAFPNEFRRHRTSEDSYRRALQCQRYELAPYRTSPSAEDEVVGILHVMEHLSEISQPRTRLAVAAVVLSDFTHEEIMRLLEARSVRAVEGILHRWRKKAKHREGERHHG
jgi:hypothetical protein